MDDARADATCAGLVACSERADGAPVAWRRGCLPRPCRQHAAASRRPIRQAAVLDQNYVSFRLSLLRQDRGPEAGQSAADDGQIGLPSAFERRFGCGSMT